MSNRPIIFSAPMIHALLDGRKTQTRRVIKPVGSLGPGWPMYPNYHNGQRVGDSSAPDFTDASDLNGGEPLYFGSTPYCPGDRLWVKESWFPIRYPGHPTLHSVTDYTYRATDAWDYDGPMPWKSPRFMPKVASRLTLIVTDVRVQRLHQISEADAIAEGIEHDRETNGYWGAEGQGVGGATRQYVFAKSAFMDIWDSLNEARGYGWEANPWVVALTFNVIKANIDSLQEAA